MFCRIAGVLTLAVSFLSCVTGYSQQLVSSSEPVSISVAEQYLFAAANQERARLGLPMLKWDSRLTNAAAKHAWQMASHGTISHQFAGEPELAARGAAAGAKFSKIAENVAEAPTAVIIHDEWMHSEGHRENLLDSVVDSIGISVVQRGDELFAVEDFGRSVRLMSFDEQEKTVHGLIEPYGLRIIEGRVEARRTCAMDTGYAGQRKPWFVMRFTASELSRLPDILKTKMLTGKYHEASIGACPAIQTGSFTGYNIAVLLYP